MLSNILGISGAMRTSPSSTHRGQCRARCQAQEVKLYIAWELRDVMGGTLLFTALRFGGVSAGRSIQLVSRWPTLLGRAHSTAFLRAASKKKLLDTNWTRMTDSHGSQPTRCPSRKFFSGHDLDKNGGERCNSCFCYYRVVNNLRIVRKYRNFDPDQVHH